VSDLPQLETDLDEERAVPPRSRRSRWILVAALAAVLVVVAALLVGWRLLTGPHTKLSPPDTIAGLHRDTSSAAGQTTDYLRDAIAANASLDSSVGAVYTDPASADRKVLLFGGTGSIGSPGNRLDAAFGLLDDQTGAVSGIHEVAAGPLGGVVRCGTSNGEGGPIPVCGWADAGSLALALFPGRTDEQAAALLAQLRGAMEHQG
jgi:hypothetical protein